MSFIASIGHRGGVVLRGIGVRQAVPDYGWPFHSDWEAA